MTLSLMAYGLVLATLLAGAAHFLDGGLRRIGRPTRWVWLGAMAGGALTPVASRFLPLGSSELSGPGPILPLELLYEMGRSGAAGSQTGTTLPQSVDGSLTALWLLASATVALVFLWALLRLRRQVRRWEKQTVGDEEVLVSSGLGPAVMGLFRPRIILPPWALTLAREKTELILLHEREHREARDPCVLAGGILLVALAPWNPALWWILSRIRLAVEGDCDGRVLAKGVRPKEYGILLLEMASRTRRVSPLALALTEGGKTFLERRLLMIPAMFGKPRIWAGSLAMLMGGFLLVLACETPVPPTAVEAEAEAVPQLSVEEAPVSRLSMETGGSPIIFVDGVEFEDGMESIDASSIERVEVVRGSNAIQEYGEEASEGVIKVFLKKTSDLDSDAAEGSAVFIQEDESASRVVLSRSSAEAGVGEEPQVAVRGSAIFIEEDESPSRVVLRGSSAEVGIEAQPLLVVDGVIVPDPNFMENLDTSTIESVEVIKGAAAEALFGPKGANGVVKITLKK